MPFTRGDEVFMARALQLAEETLALASPNPQVGCVLARDGILLAVGAHLYDAFDHAEIVALKQAQHGDQSWVPHRSPLKHGQDGLDSPTRGATAYVTLEPCSHHGRTPPCADALIAAGIARCVVATADPNPLVSGRGIAKLRAAAIDVQAGLGESRARTLNNAFALSITRHRPFVTLKSALSVDGYLAPPPSARPYLPPGTPNPLAPGSACDSEPLGTPSLQAWHSGAATNGALAPGVSLPVRGPSAPAPFWLTGPAARAEVQRLRHASDSILTGIGTVLADDPLLTDRTGRPRRRPLMRVVLDTSLRIPLSAKLVQTAAEDSSQSPHQNLWIFCGPDAPPDRRAVLQSRGVRVTCVAAPNGLDLREILAHLHASQLRSVLVEAGSALNGAFLRADLVDQAILFYAESELGPDAIPFADGTPGPFALEQRLLSVDKRSFGPDVCVSGLLHNPWPKSTDFG